MKTNFKKLLLSIVLTVFSFQVQAETSALKNTKPNIIIILSDDICWRNFGFMGSPDVKTPNLDKLADEGFVLERMYVASAMCAPTRANLYTGLYPVGSGAYPNHCIAKDGTKSIVQHLGEYGYRVGLTGKRHFAPQEVFPFKNIKGFEQNCNAKKSSFDLQPSINFWKQTPNKPFCEIIASIHAHGPFTAGDHTQYNPKQITVQPNLYDTPGLRGILCKYYAEITQLDVQVGAILKALKENDLYENTMILFLSEQGYSMPGGKWTCFEDGLRSAGIAWWPGKIPAKKRSDAIVEYSDVLPTLVEMAGGDPTAADKHFDGKSFLPLLEGKTKTHKSEAYGLQTTLGVIKGKPYPIRTIRDNRWRLIVNYMHEKEFTSGVTSSWIMKDWIKKAETNADAKKAVQRILNRPRLELYDHSKDPYETTNLAQNPEYADVIERLHKKLNAWLEQQGDSDPIKTELDAKNHQVVYNKKKHS